MQTFAKVRLAAVLALLLGALPAAAADRSVPPPAPPLTAIPCETPGQAIDEEHFVAIGGIEQWVTIRGDDCANPVILFIHGGPGNPLSPYADNIYAAWEKDFTLVQWDQRGSGMTWGRNPDETPLTLDLMTRDGVEVAAWAAARLGQRKVILMGGSWGSALAVHMARARPDLFHAYLGTGQLVDHAANQTASYRRTLDLARQAGDIATVATLEALGPPPWTNPRSFGALRRATRTYEAMATTPAPAGWWVRAPAYATDAALAAYEGGEEFSYIQFVGMTGQGMFSTVRLNDLGPDFAIPVFLVQGAEDLVTTPEVARAWFDFVRAPAKEYRLVPAAGHDPNAAIVEAQFDILKTRIRPLVR